MRRRLAAADIGSNTVHALVADVEGERGLEEVARYVETPELGLRVDRSGELGPEGRLLAADALERVVRQAEVHGIERLLVGATAALRRAADRDRALAEAGARVGEPVRLLTERREAQLSFLGVAAGHGSPGPWVMADLGGGSTELVAAQGERVLTWASLPLGSGSLAGRFLSDPPAGEEQVALRRAAKEILDQAPRVEGDRLVVTGGTASHLGLIAGSHRQPILLGRPELRVARERLCAGTASVVAAAEGLPEQRVRALRGGVEIMETLLEHYRLPALEVSHEGLRHGMVRAYLRCGDDWWRDDH